MKFISALAIAWLALFVSQPGRATEHPPVSPPHALPPLPPSAAASHALPPTSWHANWIAVPGGDGREYGIYYFRKGFDLSARPDSFLVHVSADNRYKLFINGT